MPANNRWDLIQRLKTQLNPICHLLALLGAHPIFHISRIRVNKLAPKLKFTIEKEENQKISFLDLTINRKQSRFSIDIYRKPTTTDTIIVNDSCHPREHKMAAIHYLHNRMITYDVTRKQTEGNTHYTANPT